MGDDRAAQLQALADKIEHLDGSPYTPTGGRWATRPSSARAAPTRPSCSSERRRDVYITNVVKDRPPGNWAPSAREIRVYAPFLLRQIEIIRPRVIVTLGRFALGFVLQEFGLPEQEETIGALHGKVLDAQASYGAVSIVPLYHPAAAFYDARLEAMLRDDFQVLRSI